MKTMLRTLLVLFCFALAIPASAADPVAFVTNLKGQAGTGIAKDTLKGLEDVLKQYVVVNLGTPSYAQAKGVALWMPNYTYSYSREFDKYKGLNFHAQTGWGTAAGRIAN